MVFVRLFLYYSKVFSNGSWYSRKKNWFGEVPYLFQFYNITISWLFPLVGFRFFFVLSWQVWMSSKTWHESAVCFSSRACRAHVSSHSLLGQIVSPHNPCWNFERQTDCQQSRQKLHGISRASAFVLVAKPWTRVAKPWEDWWSFLWRLRRRSPVHESRQLRRLDVSVPEQNCCSSHETNLAFPITEKSWLSSYRWQSRDSLKGF